KRVRRGFDRCGEIVAGILIGTLQREIRRLGLKGPLTSIRSKDRLNTFRSELSRIERATRSRRRREWTAMNITLRIGLALALVLSGLEIYA
ncbi:MAG: hypothetical protein V3S88_04655, partial [Alphaproteobacteria bacterium]